MQKAIPTNTNTLHTNVIMMFAAAIFAAVLAVAVASVLLANRIDAFTQQQPAATLAHAVTPATATTTAAANSCVVPGEGEPGGADTGRVLGASFVPGTHHHAHHGSTSQHTTNHTTTGNTGNKGVVNAPVNISGNSILNHNLNGNSVLNDNNVLSNNDVDILSHNQTATSIPVLNLTENQVGPTAILTSLL